MIDSVYLFTNRNCLIFNEHGEQIGELQRAISCYNLDRKVAKRVAREAKVIYIACYREWAHEISAKSFEYLLGIRTKEEDLADIEWGRKLLAREEEDEKERVCCDVPGEAEGDSPNGRDQRPPEGNCA